MFVSPGGVRGKSSEKLEFDILLNEHVTFLRSQGFQHEVQMCHKSRKENRRDRRQERKDSTEARKRTGSGWSWGARSSTKSLKSLKPQSTSGLWEKGGSVENQRFSRNRLKCIIRPEAE